jgi:hypothetical protein
MLKLWRKHKILTSLFTLALFLTIFFGVRTVRQAVYWSDPAHHNESVKPWMTVGYIAKSWHLDPREIDALADLPGPQAGHPKPLVEIAKDRGVPVQDLIKEIEAAIATLRQAAPGP